MSLESASSRLHLRAALPSSSSPLGRPRFAPNNLQMRKRRRLKLLARLGPPPILSLPFDNLVHGLLSAFPSPNSLQLIVPALGFASGAAFYFSSRESALRRREELGEPVGEWILFTSPTPFNRCVLLRCPSVSFDAGGELLEGVNDRLVREERHYVHLSRGRILAEVGAEEAGDDVSYQRLCVSTGDGGVISLDWPENLELGREQGLDTTVLLVPGTPEGSMARNVRALVHEALRHGCFPIVMNPRGCAGSPLTTPRYLFPRAFSLLTV